MSVSQNQLMRNPVRFACHVNETVSIAVETINFI